MANAKITALPSITTPASTDVVPIVDVGNDVTSKITYANLVPVTAASTNTLTNKTIDGNNNTLTVLAATQLSGITPVANGGTGRATLTSGSVLVGNGTSAVSLYTTTGSGTVLALATSPSFTTPTLGVATATSINGLTITSSTGTLTITNGKTASFTNSVTFSGTDSTVMTFPSTTDTVVTLTATQTLTNKTLTSPTINTPTITTPTINLYDGWIGTTDTLVYASATSVTIAGVNRTTTYTKGTKVKFTNNSTTYYGVVASSAFGTDTTITFIANNDYSINNSAITAPFYSYDVNPQGYPAWFNYTITFTPGGSMTWGTITTTYQRFRPRTGSSIDIQYHAFATLGGSAGNSGTINAPVSVTVVGQCGRFALSGTTEYAINVSSATNTSQTLTAGTTINIARVPATSNFDLGANSSFSLLVGAEL